MDNAPDLLRVLVEALALVARSLNRWFQIPWPLVLAVFFVPVVAVLNVGVWYLRGMTFPLPCGYITVQGEGCRRMTLGEWHKCWYHRRRRLRRTDKHLVDPNRRRWETALHEDDSVETPRVIGRGFLRMRSRRDTLLYHQGFTRPPKDVFTMLPGVFHDYKNRVLERWTSLRSLGLRGLIPLTNRVERQIATSDVLPDVIKATRLTLVMAALGLVLVGVSIAVPSSISVIFEYLATFSFVFALAFTHIGILRADPEWFGRSVWKASKWIFGFTVVATASGLIGLFAGDIKNAARAITETAFTGVILVVALYVVSGKKWRFRKRRRRRR